MRSSPRLSPPGSPPPPTTGSPIIGAAGRPRSLHWLAWAAALASLLVAALWMWGPSSPRATAILQAADIGFALFFVAEFFTRTGWRHARLSYLKWRWFDVVAIIPIAAMGPLAVAPLVWTVFVCRCIRLIDRTLGDGFVQRKAIALLGMVEEELSDRVLIKMLTRWERELEHANFGTSMAAALARNKHDVLARVYAEQLQEGAFARLAHLTGLQAALEREEERLFGALIEMVGSKEVDEAIRDVIASSLRRSREQLGAKDWRREISASAPIIAPLAPPDAGLS